MKRVILEFNGTEDNFQKAMDAMDDMFDMNDSIFYMIDYDPDSENIHHTEYGDIIMRYEEDDT